MRNGRPGERHHGLGRGERERPQPRALAAREDERLHGYLPMPS